MSGHSPNHKIVTLDMADIRDVTQLEQICFSMPWTEEQFASVFSQKNFAALGVKTYAQQGVAQPLVAYISCYHAVDELEILNIAVHPDHRRCKIGKQLLSTALQLARKMGIVRAVLEVRTGNIPALGLYQGLGFECVGRRPKYYADTGEDALILTLQLDMLPNHCAD